MKLIRAIFLTLTVLLVANCSTFKDVHMLGKDKTKWHVFTLLDSKVIDNTKAYIVFDNGRIYGNAGCNLLIGSYETNDTGHLTIKAATTYMMCIDKNAITTENDFIKVIDHTNYYTLDKGELKLFDVGNQQIATFKS